MVGIGKENVSRPVPLNSFPVAPAFELSPDFSQVSQMLVGEDVHGQRLDNFLFRIARGVPKSHIYRIVRSGQVRVNGRRAHSAYRLQTGDVLRIPPLRIARREEVRADEIVAGAQLKAELPVLYEDAALLVINKPAGLAVHGGSGVSFGVIEALRRQRPQARFLELAHRLDRETSGILLVGKKRSALTVLHDLFREGASREHGERRVDKRYFVLVAGRWREPLRHVRLPLFKFLLESGERRVRVDALGKPAHTVFRLLARWENFSLLEAELRSGRTHQIRVHCAAMGCPIAGDEKYGDFALNRVLVQKGLKRMFLHAWKVRLPHPVSGEMLSLEAPLPVALTRFLKEISCREKQDYGQAL